MQSVGQVKQIVKKKYYGGKFNEQDTTAGYTEAVLVDNTLYISGWIGRGTIAEQLQEIYSNLGSILGAFGATYQNVVKETLFTTDIEGVKNSNSVRKAFYKGDFPAATWVQITRLYSARADAQIEVELIAHLQNSKK
ncbi:MAG TPA: Rid family hydrolase [Nitrososphaeraceae archaeon]|nr:Rid family hydrolase [Nitrososphaeraceae archaeon]